MQVSGISGNSALLALQRLFQGASAASAGIGQDVPGSGQDPPSTASSTGAVGPQMGAQTMAAVLGLQTQPSDSDIASKLISSLDTNGDGQVSEDEIKSAFSQAGIDADPTAAFQQVDTNGDGQLSASELTSAVGNARQAHHHHGHGHGGGMMASASDQASSILSAFNTDGSDGLSLDEVASALGQDSSSDAVKSVFGSLDANGDGVLSADELQTAIQSQMQAAQAAYAARLSDNAGVLQQSAVI
ncbi:MAG: EF-hand domain-containing protein [Alphaproteobacteria bacterium]